MDTQVQIDVLRLQCEHLRTLLDQVITALTTRECALALEGTPTAALGAPLDTWEKQSEHLAAEIARLQGFLQSLRPQRIDALEASGESPPASPPTSDTPQMGRCQIVCTLDGKEPAVILYDKYAELDKRIFQSGRHAGPLHTFLNRRAKEMRWEAEPPRYEIVPAEE